MADEQVPVVVDEDHSAWRAMCLWLDDRDRQAQHPDGDER